MTPRRRYLGCLFLVLGLSTGACSSKIGLIRTGKHLPEREPAPLRVDSPPPPVKVEAIPLRRNKHCRYRDGEWTYEGDNWKWNKGEWIHPPPLCFYAPPETRYENLASGPALVHRPGIWHPIARANFECQAPRTCTPE